MSLPAPPPLPSRPMTAEQRKQELIAARNVFNTRDLRRQCAADREQRREDERSIRGIVAADGAAIASPNSTAIWTDSSGGVGSSGLSHSARERYSQQKLAQFRARQFLDEWVVVPHRPLSVQEVRMPGVPWWVRILYDADFHRRVAVGVTHQQRAEAEAPPTEALCIVVPRALDVPWHLSSANKCVLGDGPCARWARPFPPDGFAALPQCTVDSVASRPFAQPELYPLGPEPDDGFIIAPSSRNAGLGGKSATGGDVSFVRSFNVVRVFTAPNPAAFGRVLDFSTTSMKEADEKRKRDAANRRRSSSIIALRQASPDSAENGDHRGDHRGDHGDDGDRDARSHGDQGSKDDAQRTTTTTERRKGRRSSLVFASDVDEVQQRTERSRGFRSGLFTSHGESLILRPKRGSAFGDGCDDDEHSGTNDDNDECETTAAAQNSGGPHGQRGGVSSYAVCGRLPTNPRHVKVKRVSMTTREAAAHKFLHQSEEELLQRLQMQGRRKSRRSTLGKRGLRGVYNEATKFYDELEDLQEQSTGPAADGPSTILRVTERLARWRHLTNSLRTCASSSHASIAAAEAEEDQKRQAIATARSKLEHEHAPRDGHLSRHPPESLTVDSTLGDSRGRSTFGRSGSRFAGPTESSRGRSVDVVPSPRPHDRYSPGRGPRSPRRSTRSPGRSMSPGFDRSSSPRGGKRGTESPQSRALRQRCSEDEAQGVQHGTGQRPGSSPPGTGKRSVSVAFAPTYDESHAPLTIDASKSQSLSVANRPNSAATFNASGTFGATTGEAMPTFSRRMKRRSTAVAEAVPFPFPEGFPIEDQRSTFIGYHRGPAGGFTQNREDLLYTSRACRQAVFEVFLAIGPSPERVLERSPFVEFAAGLYELYMPSLYTNSTLVAAEDEWRCRGAPGVNPSKIDPGTSDSPGVDSQSFFSLFFDFPLLLMRGEHVTEQLYCAFWACTRVRLFPEEDVLHSPTMLAPVDVCTTGDNTNVNADAVLPGAQSIGQVSFDQLPPSHSAEAAASNGRIGAGTRVEMKSPLERRASGSVRHYPTPPATAPATARADRRRSSTHLGASARAAAFIGQPVYPTGAATARSSGPSSRRGSTLAPASSPGAGAGGAISGGTVASSDTNGRGVSASGVVEGGTVWRVTERRKAELERQVMHSKEVSSLPEARRIAVTKRKVATLLRQEQMAAVRREERARRRSLAFEAGDGNGDGLDNVGTQHGIDHRPNSSKRNSVSGPPLASRAPGKSESDHQIRSQTPPRAFGACIGSPIHGVTDPSVVDAGHVERLKYLASQSDDNKRLVRSLERISQLDRDPNTAAMRGPGHVSPRRHRRQSPSGALGSDDTADDDSSSDDQQTTGNFGPSQSNTYARRHFPASSAEQVSRHDDGARSPTASTARKSYFTGQSFDAASIAALQSGSPRNATSSPTKGQGQGSISGSVASGRGSKATLTLEDQQREVARLADEIKQVTKIIHDRDCEARAPGAADVDDLLDFLEDGDLSDASSSLSSSKYTWITDSDERSEIDPGGSRLGSPQRSLLASPRSAVGGDSGAGGAVSPSLMDDDRPQLQFGDQCCGAVGIPDAAEEHERSLRQGNENGDDGSPGSREHRQTSGEGGLGGMWMSSGTPTGSPTTRDAVLDMASSASSNIAGVDPKKRRHRSRGAIVLGEGDETILARPPAPMHHSKSRMRMKAPKIDATTGHEIKDVAQHPSDPHQDEHTSVISPRSERSCASDRSVSFVGYTAGGVDLSASPPRSPLSPARALHAQQAGLHSDEAAPPMVLPDTAKLGAAQNNKSFRRDERGKWWKRVKRDDYEEIEVVHLPSPGESAAGTEDSTTFAVTLRRGQSVTKRRKKVQRRPSTASTTKASGVPSMRSIFSPPTTGARAKFDAQRQRVAAAAADELRQRKDNLEYRHSMALKALRQAQHRASHAVAEAAANDESDLSPRSGTSRMLGSSHRGLSFTSGGTFSRWSSGRHSRALGSPVGSASVSGSTQSSRRSPRSIVGGQRGTTVGIPPRLTRVILPDDDEDGGVMEVTGRRRSTIAFERRRSSAAKPPLAFSVLSHNANPTAPHRGGDSKTEMMHRSRNRGEASDRSSGRSNRSMKQRQQSPVSSSTDAHHDDAGGDDAEVDQEFDHDDDDPQHTSGSQQTVPRKPKPSNQRPPKFALDEDDFYPEGRDGITAARAPPSSSALEAKRAKALATRQALQASMLQRLNPETLGERSPGVKVSRSRRQTEEKQQQQATAVNGKVPLPEFLAQAVDDLPPRPPHGPHAGPGLPPIRTRSPMAASVASGGASVTSNFCQTVVSKTATSAPSTPEVAPHAGPHGSRGPPQTSFILNSPGALGHLKSVASSDYSVTSNVSSTIVGALGSPRLASSGSVLSTSTMQPYGMPFWSAERVAAVRQAARMYVQSLGKPPPPSPPPPEEALGGPGTASVSKLHSARLAAYGCRPTPQHPSQPEQSNNESDQFLEGGQSKTLRRDDNGPGTGGDDHDSAVRRRLHWTFDEATDAARFKSKSSRVVNATQPPRCLQSTKSQNPSRGREHDQPSSAAPAGPAATEVGEYNMFAAPFSGSRVAAQGSTAPPKTLTPMASLPRGAKAALVKTKRVHRRQPDGSVKMVEEQVTTRETRVGGRVFLVREPKQQRRSPPASSTAAVSQGDQHLGGGRHAKGGTVSMEKSHANTNASEVLYQRMAREAAAIEAALREAGEPLFSSEDEEDDDDLGASDRDTAARAASPPTVSLSSSSSPQVDQRPDKHRRSGDGFDDDDRLSSATTSRRASIDLMSESGAAVSAQAAVSGHGHISDSQQLAGQLRDPPGALNRPATRPAVGEASAPFSPAHDPDVESKTAPRERSETATTPNQPPDPKVPQEVTNSTNGDRPDGVSGNAGNDVDGGDDADEQMQVETERRRPHSSPARRVGWRPGDQRPSLFQTVIDTRSKLLGSKQSPASSTASVAGSRTAPSSGESPGRTPSRPASASHAKSVPPSALPSSTAPDRVVNSRGNSPRHLPAVHAALSSCSLSPEPRSGGDSDRERRRLERLLRARDEATASAAAVAGDSDTSPLQSPPRTLVTPTGEALTLASPRSVAASPLGSTRRSVQLPPGLPLSPRNDSTSNTAASAAAGSGGSAAGGGGRGGGGSARPSSAPVRSPSPANRPGKGGRSGLVQGTTCLTPRAQAQTEAVQPASNNTEVSPRDASGHVNGASTETCQKHGVNSTPRSRRTSAEVQPTATAPHHAKRIVVTTRTRGAHHAPPHVQGLPQQRGHTHQGSAEPSRAAPLVSPRSSQDEVRTPPSLPPRPPSGTRRPQHTHQSSHGQTLAQPIVGVASTISPRSEGSSMAAVDGAVIARVQKADGSQAPGAVESQGNQSFGNPLMGGGVSNASIGLESNATSSLAAKVGQLSFQCESLNATARSLVVTSDGDRDREDEESRPAAAAALTSAPTSMDGVEARTATSRANTGRPRCERPSSSPPTRAGSERPQGSPRGQASPRAPSSTPATPRRFVTVRRESGLRPRTQADRK